MTFPGNDPTVPATDYGRPGAADPTLPAQPGYGGGPGGGSGGNGAGWDDGGDDDRRKLWMIGGAVLILGLLIGALVAVLASSGGDSKASSTTSSSSTSSSTTSSSTTSTSTTSTTKGAGPSIIQYSASPNPVTCPTAASTPMITLTWATQNTSGVTVSIDNPNGPYGTYPQSTGQGQFPFACSVNPVQHTYYLTANGTNGTKPQQSIVVTGNVVAPTTTSTTHH